MDTKADLIRYDIRRDRRGWTVYDVRSGETAVIAGVLQVGLAMDEADAVADALSAGEPVPDITGVWAGWQGGAAADGGRFRWA
ncbi:hypothetical protein [Methylobacterium sp. JK268]